MLPPVHATLLASTVADLVGAPYARIWRHGDAPAAQSEPYVTWSIVTSAPENELSDVPGIDRVTVQLDVWSDDDAGIEALAVAVRDAVEPVAHMTGIVVNERDAATRLYRIGMQFDWFLSR